ncbi:MAG: helix-turn-helix domain-containing protein [Rhodospirillaceae bacterium]|nr:helix-turn-helix transcriptional regulator [Rhodospirillaceae bacterium]MXW91453.1 helix-turn-helix domain-containing protein [Rhodospirillaceae bacterium]MYB12591.1 helix-turn-helix domain-containing protein [Rhodospirillaceae bacterium]MYI50076.1 helix-turn-helix domain-containing protein [Rhodospirillaceae bacterium]
MNRENPRVGSTLDSLLRRDDAYEDIRNDAIKATLAYKLKEAMEAQNISKARMAERMETSRSQLDRLLDPENEGVTLHTLKRAAAAVGMRLNLEIRQI